MGDPLGSFARVSFQKQNREGNVGAQSVQYRATIESSPGWDVTIWYQSHSAVRCGCADELGP